MANGKKKPNNITKSEERRISKVRKKIIKLEWQEYGPQAYKKIKIKRPQRKQTGPKEPKEGSSKPMRIIRNGKQAKWVGGT